MTKKKSSRSKQQQQSSPTGSSVQVVVVEQPNSDDILLGRKACIFHHPGNRRYRDLINVNLPRYRELENKKLSRSIFIKELLDKILKNGRVRFLRYKEGQWTSVPFKTVKEKIAHALRDGVAKAIFGLDKNNNNNSDAKVNMMVKNDSILLRHYDDEDKIKEGEDARDNQLLYPLEERQNKKATKQQIQRPKTDYQYAHLVQKIAQVKVIEELEAIKKLKAKAAFLALVNHQQNLKQQQQQQLQLQDNTTYTSSDSLMLMLGLNTR